MRSWIVRFAILAMVIAFAPASIGIAAAQQTKEPLSTPATSADGTIFVADIKKCEWNARFGGNGWFYFRLQQEGERVWGEYDSPDTRTSYSGAKVEGTIKGKKLSLKIPEFEFGHLELTVDGDQITGSGSARANIPFSVVQCARAR